jgi:hypothetical protein
MAFSTVTYTVPNPAVTEYAIPFPFLQDNNITVEVNGVDTPDFDIAPTKDSLDITAPPLLPDDLVTITRTTPINVPLVAFADPATLRRDDLDRMQKQLLYAVQEAVDGSTSGLQLDLADSKWDAEDRPIKDLEDPTNAQDAATKGWVESAFVTGGVLPTPVLADALKFLRVNTLGTGYLLSPSLTERYLLRIQSQGSGPVGWNLGWVLPAFAANFNNHDDQRAPLEIVEDFNDLGLLSLADDYTVTVGAGQWVIEVNWTVRGLTDTANVNITEAQMAITDELGAPLTNATSPEVITGYAVQVQDSGATITKTGGISTRLHMVYFANFVANTNINFRGRGSTSSHAVVVDYPSFISITRVTR